MNPLAATRMRSIPYSPIRAIFDEARRLEAEGYSIIHLEIGLPNFDTPVNIKQAAQAALERGEVHYTPNRGLPELNHAIAQKLARENSVVVEPDQGVMVTVGTNEAVACTMLALVNKGDEVIVPTPAWPHYQAAIALAGGVVIELPLHIEEDYQLNPDQLQQLLSERTKLIVINSPHNPTGTVLDEETIRGVAQIAIENGIPVLSDEIYEHLIYNGHHVSIGSIPGMEELALTINGFSKAFSMTGWRLGYVAAHPALLEPLVRVHQYVTTSACSFGQRGAITALTGTMQDVVWMRQCYHQRRELVMEALASADIPCFEPRGTFYAFPSFKKLRRSSLDISSYFLQEAGVALAPGSAFGDAGEGHLRISFSVEEELLREGLSRLSSSARKLLAA